MTDSPPKGDFKRSRKYIRLDFQIEVLSSDDESRTLTVALSPDPRRFSKFTRKGETYWKDRYLNFTFGWDLLKKMGPGAGVPMFYSPAEIKNAAEYASRRALAIKREFSGVSYQAPEEISDQHHGLPEESVEIDATFLSIDVVNSTKLRAKYGLKYDKVLELIIREMGTSVGHFHGQMLKFTGDGFIAFLDHPSINCQCDNAIDLGLSLLRVLDAINDATPRTHPKLEVRIGAEHGEARVKCYAVPATGYKQADMVCDALNRAAKIQERTPANALVIGRALYERIHVQWLERASEIKLGVDVGLRSYRTYIIH